MEPVRWSLRNQDSNLLRHHVVLCPWMKTVLLIVESRSGEELVGWSCPDRESHHLSVQLNSNALTWRMLRRKKMLRSGLEGQENVLYYIETRPPEQQFLLDVRRKICYNWFCSLPNTSWLDGRILYVGLCRDGRSWLDFETFEPEPTFG